MFDFDAGGCIEEGGSMGPKGETRRGERVLVRSGVRGRLICFLWRMRWWRGKGGMGEGQFPGSKRGGGTSGKMVPGKGALGVEASG